jgi:hypothetical protein
MSQHAPAAKPSPRVGCPLGRDCGIAGFVIQPQADAPPSPGRLLQPAGVAHHLPPLQLAVAAVGLDPHGAQVEEPPAPLLFAGVPAHGLGEARQLSAGLAHGQAAGQLDVYRDHVVGEPIASRPRRVSSRFRAVRLLPMVAMVT